MAKLADVINMSYDNRKAKMQIQQKLMETPMFRKYDSIEDVEMEMLEAAMQKLCNKFPICMSYILFNPKNSPAYFSLMIKETDKHQHLITIYSKTIREALEKFIVYSYYYCKKNYMEGQG